MAVLKNEFEAGAGSFFIKLRPGLEWDKAAINQLTAAMKCCAEIKSNDTKLDRWLAEGFWFVPRFVREWTTHPNFPKVYSDEYYTKAFSQLDDLAYWYFMGQSPFENGKNFEELA